MLTGLRTAEQLADTKPHGTRLRYLGGCKCMKCRAANSRYQSERLAASKRGEWNGLIDAREVCEHIAHLRAHNIGIRSICDIAGICRSSLQKTVSGERKFIRKLNADKILAITEEAISDGHLIDAKPTWKRIRRLLNEGFTYASFANRLGYKSPSSVFNIGRVQCKASTARKIEKFYEMIFAGE